MSAIHVLRKLSRKPPSRLHRNLLASTFSMDLPPDLARTTLIRPFLNHPTHRLIPSCFRQSRPLPNPVSLREFSTSVVETKNFERVVGLSPNPLVIERIHKDTGESVSGGEIQIEESLVVREESEAEKEAWRILEDAVVRYCGSPVGTVAANDPGDKFPLNYDQVFIRDFVPSALAFLLKGEGEIVRNFLLHTLQLQVSLQNVSFRLLT